VDDGHDALATDEFDELDELVREAGETHVIPPRERPALLERLRDPAVLERARTHLDSKDESWRTRGILCLERIAYVLRDQETAELLLAYATRARSKYEASTALTALHRCTPPEPLDAGTLVELVRRREWLVWHEAVRCLHLAVPEEVEPALLERLDADRYGLGYVAFELRFMRSPRSLRALESLLDHESVDVRCTALSSLGERLGPGVLPYARRFAASRRLEDKLTAEAWLGRHGTVEDVPFLAKRLLHLLGSPRKRDYRPPELSYVVPFLLRFREEPRAAAALARLAERVDRLSQTERDWVHANAPALGASLASAARSD
jgi:hypothetical protein